MDGIINVRKEKGFTSFDVVAKLRGILKMKKIGHTGTLDPDAEGVLPVCIGKATRVCDLLTDKDKVYEAVMLLGKETDTQDMTGTILKESKVNLSIEEVKQCIESFVGEYAQIPPMYSALKVNGKKLCVKHISHCDYLRNYFPIFNIPCLLDTRMPFFFILAQPAKSSRQNCVFVLYFRGETAILFVNKISYYF